MMKEARAEFDEIDANNDGQATWAEMKAFILKEDPKLTQEEIDEDEETFNGIAKGKTYFTWADYKAAIIKKCGY